MGFVFEFEFSHIIVFILGFAAAWFIFRKQGHEPNPATRANPQPVSTSVTPPPKIDTPSAPPAPKLAPSNPPVVVSTPSNPATANTTVAASKELVPEAKQRSKGKEHRRTGSDSRAFAAHDNAAAKPVPLKGPLANLATGDRKSLPQGVDLHPIQDPVPMGTPGGRRTPVAQRAAPGSHIGTPSLPRSATPKLGEKNPMNVNLDELKVAFANPVTGVQTRKRKSKLGKTQKGVFSGTDAVDWLLGNVEGGIDRKKAIDIGVRLWAAGLFRHVSHRHRPFSDGSHELFRFLTKSDTDKHHKSSASKRSIRRKPKLSDSERSPTAMNSPLRESLDTTSAWLDIKETQGWARRWCIVQKENIVSEEGTSTSSLHVYDHCTAQPLLELIQQMTSSNSGLKIKTGRRYFLKAYSKCFSGKRAVDWIISKRPEVETREQAVVLMNKLIQKGLLHNVKPDKFIFKDNSSNYSFLPPEEEDITEKEKELRQSSSDIKEMLAQTPHLLGRIPLGQDLLFKLNKEGNNVFVILYHNHAKPVLEQEGKDVHANLMKVEDPKNFVTRMHERDEDNVKQWLFALQSAVLIEGVAPEEYCYDSGEESDEEFFSEDDHSEAEAMGDVSKEVMTSAEQAVLAEVKEILSQEKESGQQVGPLDFTQVPDTELIKYIRARKLEIGPAVTLIKAGIPYRLENSFDKTKITDVLEEVRGGMCRLIPDARDKDGRVILVLLPQNYRPARSSPIALVRAMYYLLDLALDADENTQRMGFSVVVDCKGSKYANFDAAMPKVLVNGIVGKYPARVGHVIILNTPWFFRFIWAAMRPLISDVLAAKFHIIGMEEMTNYIDSASLLPMHGGHSPYDHEAWIRSRFEKEGIPYVPP